MGENENSESELLLEARRTTHAARALARFVILFATYQVIWGFLVGIGVVLSFTTGDTGALVAVVIIGGLIALVGILHSLSAGHSELAGSERRAIGAPAPRLEDNAPPKVDEHGLFEGVCSCTKWERGIGGTAFVEGIEYCERCNRVLPQ